MLFAFMDIIQINENAIYALFGTATVMRNQNDKQGLLVLVSVGSVHQPKLSGQSQL